MTANITFYSRVFPGKDGQSVLDLLLENGQEIPHSCKMGVCVTCLMKVTDGTVPAEAQEGLRPTLARQGYFLPCVCAANGDMRISHAEPQDLFSPAVVQHIDHLQADICRLFLEPATPLYYRAGQFLNIRREDGLSRSYSLASVPSLDGPLEFHVKRLQDGQMSNWLLDELRPGDHLAIQGPLGNCYYQPGQADQGMLLIGNGSGLAPLLGIAKDALTSGHRGQIHLYHGSRTVAGVYLHDELLALQTKHDNFHYAACVSGDEAAAGYRRGRAEDIAFSDHGGLSDWRLFLCGYPPMVYGARDRAVGAGASLADIYTDPFELKDLRQAPRV